MKCAIAVFLIVSFLVLSNGTEAFNSGESRHWEGQSYEDSDQRINEVGDVGSYDQLSGALNDYDYDYDYGKGPPLTGPENEPHPDKGQPLEKWKDEEFEDLRPGRRIFQIDEQIWKENEGYRESDIDEVNHMMDKGLDDELNEEMGLKSSHHIEVNRRKFGGLFPMNGNGGNIPGNAYSYIGRYTQWTQWLACNVTCGNGHQSRSRGCLIGEMYCRKSDLIETRVCHVIHCQQTLIAFIAVISILGTLVATGATIGTVYVIYVKRKTGKYPFPFGRRNKAVDKRNPRDPIPPPPTATRPPAPLPRPSHTMEPNYVAISNQESDEDLYIDPFEDVPKPERSESEGPEYPAPLPPDQGKDNTDEENPYELPQEDLYMEIEAS